MNPPENSFCFNSPMHGHPLSTDGKVLMQHDATGAFPSGIQMAAGNFKGASFTLLQCGMGKLAAKQLRPDGQWEDYKCGFYFDAVVVPLADLEDLGGWLAAISPRPRLFIIRGSPLAGDAVTGARRLGPNYGAEAVFTDVARAWIMLDLDRVKIPASVDLHDIVACARAAQDGLPAPFQGACCVVQASVGHTFKPGCCLHLWYWLSTPITCAEAKRWLKSLDAPKSTLDLMQPVQPHYIAQPLFHNGMIDALPRRVAMLDGAPVVQVPDIASLPGEGLEAT